jgi:uncharacterized protein YdeI (YjbR/CyaY-like superfamily)
MIKPITADDFIENGCGRCPKGGTEHCKVHTWTKELTLLRSWCLQSGLEETIKWGVPCYTYKQKNVLVIGALKESCTLGFFKGILLNDPEQILGVSGENTQETRILKFKHIDEILKLEDWIKIFIQDAIDIEEKGLKPPKNKDKKWDLPEEMVSFFKTHTEVGKAFERLTPGRQRSWIIFINGAKQSTTKLSRLSKAVPLILQGKGMHD